MSPTSSRTRHPGHLVTAIIMCRDGAARLPKTLDALAHQVRRADRVVVVDFASTDRTVAIATDRVGKSHIVELDAFAGVGAAVSAGLELLAGRPDRRSRDDAPVEWLWLLHDDSEPEPEALDELLLRVVHSPSVWLAGPKVLDGNGSLLVQAGLSIDAAGHVETGLDRREPDQGQRDDTDEVLAVGVAGSLVRRDIWDSLGGMDPQFAEFGAEIDLGWRVNAAGGRVVVVPRAVVRHVGESCAGDRPAGSPVRSLVVRRRNGMRIVLANTADFLVPLLLLRYVVVGVLHSIALVVLSRRPREAAAELSALGQVVAAPGALIASRRSRKASRDVSYGDLRRLFPPSGRWVSSLVTMRPQSGAAPDAPVSRRRVAVESGPVSEEAESLADEISAVGEFLRRPGSLLFILLSLLAVIADRHVLSGTIHGGRLLPMPSGASDLWSSYVSAWHPSNIGSTAPSPPSVALLALFSTVLLGKTWLAIDILVLGAVPLAALSAFTSLRILTTAVRIRVWVCVVYALLPAVTGAIATGRLDVIVTAIVLPRVVRSITLALQHDAFGTVRGRAVRAGLWLAVAAAFAPLLWVFAAAACVGFLAIGYLRSADPAADAGGGGHLGGALRERLSVTAGVLGIPLVVLLPWTWHVIAHPSVLFAGSGLPEFYASHSAPSGVLIALLRAGGPAQPPFWVGIPIVGAIVLGLQRDSRIAAARLGAIAFVVGVVVAIVMTRGANVTSGFASTRHWPGLVLLVAGAGALLTAVVAAVGARPALRDQSFGWRQPTAVVIVGLALVATATLVGGWLIRGVAKPLRGNEPAILPLYVQAELKVPTAGRALILGGDAHNVHYALVRMPGGPVLGSGDQAVSGHSADRASAHLAAAVQDLVAGKPGAGPELVPFGVNYVVAANRTARHVASQLGRASTLTVIPVPSATVWHSSLNTGEITVLTGSAAATASRGDLPSAAPAEVLPGNGSVVAAGSGSRLLVLAEPAESRWHATLGGQQLRPTTAYGWAQAFELPARAGKIRVSFDSGSRHWWLVVQLAALVAVILFGAGAGPHTHRKTTL
ncbi:MAG TPA: glycosyltransferase [Mycobacteriales bacterium]|nr:glycosyltransferase [Mycobacteriales bacterium]